MFKKLFSDSFLYAIGPQLPKLVGLFLLPILTKFLTAEDYAIYGIAMAYIGGLQGLRELGMSQVLVNQFYRKHNDDTHWKIIWRHISGMLHVWGILYTLILGVIIYATMHFRIGTETIVMLILVLLPALLFEVTINYGFRYFLILQKPLPVAINATIAGIISIFVNYISIVWYNQHYMGFFWAQFASNIFSFLFFSYFLYVKDALRPIFRFKLRDMNPHFKVALPTIPHNYSSYLLNASDRVVLDTMKVPLQSIGQYNFAYTFGNYVDMIGSALGMAVSPFYLRFYAERNELAEKNVRFLTFLLQYLFVLGSMLLGLWCKELLTLLSSNIELSAAYPLAMIIIMSYCYRPMYWGTVNRLGFEEKTGHLWKISFIGGAINIVLNLVFIPVIGIYATVISTFLGLMYIGFAGFFLKAYKQLVKLNYYPFVWLLVIIGVTILLYFFQDASIVLKFLITATALLCSLILGFFFKKSIINLNQVI